MQLYGRGTGERRETKPLCNFINCTFGHIFREKRCGDGTRRSKAAPAHRSGCGSQRFER